MKLLLLPLAALALVRTPRGQETVVLEDLGLTLDFSAFETHGGRTFGGQLRGAWSGRLDGAEVSLDLFALDAGAFGFEEPGEVANDVVRFLRESLDVTVDRSFQLQGPYGWATYLTVVSGPLVAGGEETGRRYVAAGLLPRHGYALHATLRPATAETTSALETFLREALRYAGDVRDPRWSLDEVRARWRADAPEGVQEEFERNLSKPAWVKKSLLRTDHYLVMTNSSGGALFAKKLEENFRAIAETYPFEDIEGMRLMPVFLFQSEGEYHDFCVQRGMSRENARRSAGHAAADYYATSYRSPQDPVHLHEQVHQIFGNRLFLSGGGSWFQEGVAEYVSSSHNDRNGIAREVKKGRHTPLVEFLQLRSLLFSSEAAPSGGDRAADHYRQAALLIEFLREGEWGRERFGEFLTTVGHVRRGDLEALRAALRGIYDASIEELDRAFQDWCAKR